MAKTEARVPLTELMGELGLPTLPDLDGHEVAPDWAGRPSLSLDDAAGLVAKRRAAAERQESAWAAHQRENEAWLAGRITAARAAGSKAIAAQPETPARYARYRAAYGEAMIAFQRDHPRPEWNGEPSLPAGLLVTADAVASAVAGEAR